MSLTKLKAYINKENSVAFVIVIIGLALMPLFHYSWIISMISCFFLKEDKIT